MLNVLDVRLASSDGLFKCNFCEEGLLLFLGEEIIIPVKDVWVLLDFVCTNQYYTQLQDSYNLQLTYLT